MIILLMGPPGCGKGTLSFLLSKEYKFIHISTGELIRKEIKEGGDLARKINEYVIEGKLAPDSIVNELLKKTIIKDISEKKDIILDGYPRNVDQAKFLEDIASINYVFNINVDPKILTKRILGRRTCNQCGRIYNVFFNPPKEDNICDDDKSILLQRVDDNEETIQKRIAVFNKNNEDLINFYRDKKVLFDIDGASDINEIFYKVKKIINLK